MKNLYKNIPLPIWLLCTVTFISKIGVMIFFLFPLYLIQKLNFNVTTMGQILAFYGLGQIIGSYLGGELTDRLGCLSVQTISLFIKGICFLLFGYLDSKFEIIIVMLVIGLVNAATRPAEDANLAQYSEPGTYARSYALHLQATSLGVLIGSVFSGILAASNYTWLFRISGIGSLIASILLITLFYNRADRIIHFAKNDTMKILFPWKNIHFLMLLSLVLLMGMCLSLALSTYSVYTKEYYHISELKLGIIFSISTVIIILFQMPITTYLKQFNELLVIGAGGMLIALGYFILPFYSGFSYAILSITFISAGEAIAIPTLYNYVIKMAPEESRGRYLGLTNCMNASVPLMITPIVSTFIYSTYQPNTLWFGTGVLGFIILLGFIALEKFYSKDKLIAEYQ